MVSRNLTKLPVGKYAEHPKPSVRYEVRRPENASDKFQLANDQKDKGKEKAKGKAKEKEKEKEKEKGDEDVDQWKVKLEQADGLDADLEGLQVLNPSDFGIEVVEVPNEIEETEEDRDPVKKAEKIEASILSRIKRYPIYDIQSLLALLQQMRESLRVKEPPFYNNLRLIVIDSLASVISPILGRHSIGHSMMSSLGFLLKEIARVYGVAILYTNYLVSGGEGRERLLEETMQPALGSSWAVTSNCLIYLDQLKTARGWSGGGGEGGGCGSIFEATVAKCGHIMPNEGNTHNTTSHTFDVMSTKYRFTISDLGIEGLDALAEAAQLQEWERNVVAVEEGMEWEGEGELEYGGEDAGQAAMEVSYEEAMPPPPAGYQDRKRGGGQRW